MNAAPSRSDSAADVFYPASSEEQGSARDSHSSENLDQMSKENFSNDSVTSEKYYTPDEEDQYFSDFTVSLSCVFGKVSLQGFFQRFVSWEGGGGRRHRGIES